MCSEAFGGVWADCLTHYVALKPPGSKGWWVCGCVFVARSNEERVGIRCCRFVSLVSMIRWVVSEVSVWVLSVVVAKDGEHSLCVPKLSGRVCADWLTPL